MLGYYILIGAIALVSWLVSNQLKQKFKKYSQIQLRNGMSGKEIAEKMVISLNTVLYHTKNIYNKLGVNKRTQAVLKAQELRLL